jgi:hypothetical protein
MAASKDPVFSLAQNRWLDRTACSFFFEKKKAAIFDSLILDFS